MVVVAQFAEGTPATLHLAIRTDRSTTVGALLHGRLTAWRSCVAVTSYVFDLTVGIHRDSVEYVSGWFSQTKNKGESDTQGDGADQKVPEDW